MDTLPQELIDEVIDFSDDWRTLAACAYVHPDWAPRARSRLRGGIELQLTVGRPSCPDIDDFLRIFSPSSPLASDVSILSICGPHQPSIASLPPIPATFALDHLPHLRSLTFRSVLVPGIEHFIEVLASCSSLEELRIETVAEDPATPIALPATPVRLLLTRTRTRNLASLSPSRFARLKTMYICDSDLSGFMFRVVALAKGSPPAPVKSLSFHLYIRAPATPHRIRIGAALVAKCTVDAWHEPLLEMRETLTEISVTVPFPLHSFYGLKHLPAAIICCRHLRRLTLRYTPLANYPAKHAQFMVALHTLLTYASTQGTRADRMLQELEMLTVILPHAPPDIPSVYEEELYEEELVQFARMLAEGAFPALACVRVGVEGALDDPLQGMVENTAAALQPLRECGLDVDVVGLHADEWEAWCAALPA